MKNIITLLLALLILQPQAKAADDYEKLLFKGKNLKLSHQERHAIRIAEKWRNDSANGDHGGMPVTGRDGSINYLFGASQASVMCAVMQVCDIQLQQGEKVNSVHLGDKARWTVEPAITGSGALEIIHVIVKPHDVGLDTTLILTTDRRTYNIRLRSHRSKFMPRITFTYPEDALAKWNSIKRVAKQEKVRQTIPQTGEYLGELNFNYTIDGKADWKPLRVYNDGVKTVIQMPDVMRQTEAPTLLVVRENSGLFSDDEEIIVNYRLQGDRFIVDAIFDNAILIAGVGSNQTRVTIERNKL